MKALACVGAGLLSITLSAAAETAAPPYIVIFAAEAMAPAGQHHKVGHLAHFARREKVTTIPDPAATGYARTLACLQDACEGWVVNHLVRRPSR